MTIVRKLIVGMSGLIVALWLAAWLPVELLPMFLHRFLFWFGAALTVLLIPAGVGLWWGFKNLSSPASTSEIK